MRTSIFLPLVAPRDTILLIGAQGATHFLLEKNLRSGPSRHLSILGDPFWYLINATVTHSSLSFCLSLFQSALSIMPAVNARVLNTFCVQRSLLRVYKSFVRVYRSVVGVWPAVTEKVTNKFCTQSFSPVGSLSSSLSLSLPYFFCPTNPCT